jgi:hypothetical protein
MHKSAKPSVKRVKKNAPTPPPPSKPEWLMSTPATLYSLEACHTSGIGNEQLIELTQAEFNYLKESLYEMRKKQEVSNA